MDKLTPEQRHKNMQAVKSKGTKIEIIFGKSLWRAGIRYRKNDSGIFGKPDFTIRGKKIAIFCDGEFWHGKDWDIHINDHKSKQDFWIPKIEKNIQRDKTVNERLTAEGWTVLRFWETDIIQHLEDCIITVMQTANKKRVSKTNISHKETKHSDMANQNTISCNEQTAVISHYLHNRNFISGKTYEKTASKLITSLYGINIREHGGIVSDTAVQYNMFNEFFSVPFPAHENTSFTFIDLFAGIGGFRLALQDLGGRCIFSSEWDEQAQKTYMLNFGDMPFGDITTEKVKSYIPDNFDILCAGFPCQAFSLAGKRKGFEETRGTLFFDVAEIIRRKRPKAFFLENVKGLLIHDKGKTIETILRVLREELDYYVPDPQVINAMNFGVPQHRERVYIVGFRKDQNITNFTYPTPVKCDVTFADIREENPVSAKYYLSTQYKHTLIEHKRRHESKGNGFGYEIIPDNGIANAIVVGGMGRERNIVIDTRLSDFTPVTRIKGEINRDGWRRMTPREWARLQGFPDNFIIGVADASAYKQFGNSVAVPAIKATAKKIIEKLKLNEKHLY